MTGEEIITFFEGLIDGDSLDDTTAYSLMNFVKDGIEAERPWEFLKKKDTSKTAVATAIDLPTDFLLPLWLFVGNDRVPYAQIPYEQSLIFTNYTRKFYIDWANFTYTLVGAQAGGTISNYYIYSTPDIDADSEPKWPDKFHKLIAIAMAELFYAVDQSQKIDSWDQKWEQIGKNFLSGMIAWDNNLKKRALDNGFSIVDIQEGSPEIPLGMM